MKRSCASILGGIALTVWLAALVSPPAHAQLRPTWEVSAFGGGHLAGDIYSYEGTRVRLKDTWTYGGRVGAQLTSQFALEAVYGRASSKLEARGSFPPEVALGSVTTNMVDLNGIFGDSFYRQAFGYFTFGIGMTIFTPHVADLDQGTRTRFATTFGIGLKYFMNPKLGLRIEGKYRLTDTNWASGDYVYCYPPPYGCYRYVSTWYDSGDITAGLTYRFGAQ
jgi:hypothetical protein